LSRTLTGHRPLRPAHLCAATSLALWLEPVFQTVLFGQINLAIACLVLWDLTRPKPGHRTGIGIGIAAGIKLTPAVFIAYLFLTGRTRDALTATASFAGTVLLGTLVLPAASVEFWTRRVFETGRVGKAWIVDNQSLQGLIARVLHDAEPGLAWAAPAALTATAGLWLARTTARTEPHTHTHTHAHAHALLLTAFTALLVSPISWSHHWVWCVPLIALLAAENRPRLAAAVTVLFTARTFWLLPHQGDLDLRLPWWQQPLAAPYPLLALALLPMLSTYLSTRTEVPHPRPGIDSPHGHGTRSRDGVARGVGRP
ncbi:glycosyltransferase 87 family protein, partial [Streptomyces luteocolor]|uniref:glycosyltransferase 87 family protein n=1 Tax=Streptomyces luteocolor TaxID=285500 RepID=UPI0008536A94